MFKYFVYNANTYSHTYQNQAVACDQAKLVSAIHRCHTSVVDMKTGEVIQLYYCGLAVE